MKLLWPALYVCAFIIGICLHTTGAFYDPIEMEKSERIIKPLLVTCIPLFLIFLANVFFFETGFNSSSTVKNTSYKELLKSVIRTLVQVLGILTMLRLPIPFLSQISEALAYLTGTVDQLWAAIEQIIGIGITLVGFFYDKARFQAREIGTSVIAKAKTSGQSIENLIRNY